MNSARCVSFINGLINILHNAWMLSRLSICRPGQTRVHQGAESNSSFFSVLWALVFMPWLKDSIRKPESTTERTDRRHYNQQLIKAFCMKIHQCQQGGQRDEKYYLRYEMFLLNTQIEVKLCCFCFPIYILIRLSKDMQGGDEQRLRKLFQYSSGSSILTKVYLALWCGRRWWIDLQS